MISVQVEKEIKQENRIFGSFTLRQVAVLGTAAVLIIGFYMLTKSDMNTMMCIGMALGIAGYFIGFKKKNGMYMEYYAVKKIKEFIFMNNQRKYKTKNKYIVMMNKAYLDDKNADMQDKKKKKILEKRIAKSKNRKTRLKSYM